MALIDELRTSIGRTVMLTFSDGEVVDATIKEVDTEEHDDVIYEVVRVRTRGPQARNPHDLVRATISEIVRVSDPT